MRFSPGCLCCTDCYCPFHPTSLCLVIPGGFCPSTVALLTYNALSKTWDGDSQILAYCAPTHVAWRLYCRGKLEKLIATNIYCKDAVEFWANVDATPGAMESLDATSGVLAGGFGVPLSCSPYIASFMTIYGRAYVFEPTTVARNILRGGGAPQPEGTRVADTFCDPGQRFEGLAPSTDPSCGYFRSPDTWSIFINPSLVVGAPDDPSRTQLAFVYINGGLVKVGPCSWAAHSAKEISGLFTRHESKIELNQIGTYWELILTVYADSTYVIKFRSTDDLFLCNAITLSMLRLYYYSGELYVAGAAATPAFYVNACAGAGMMQNYCIDPTLLTCATQRYPPYKLTITTSSSCPELNAPPFDIYFNAGPFGAWYGVSFYSLGGRDYVAFGSASPFIGAGVTIYEIVHSTGLSGEVPGMYAVYTAVPPASIDQSLMCNPLAITTNISVGTSILSRRCPGTVITVTTTASE